MSSREPKRIPEILAILGELWLANPNLRLGQIIENAAITFYTEDDKALMGLTQWRDYYQERSPRA
jgi:hypothetical protein